MNWGENYKSAKKSALSSFLNIIFFTNGPEDLSIAEFVSCKNISSPMSNSIF